MGEDGFKQAGYLSAKTAQSLSEKLEKKGFKTLNKNFYNEFTVEVPDSDEFLAKLKDNNILGGIKLDKTHILVACTEMTTETDIEQYIKSV